MGINKLKVVAGTDAVKEPAETMDFINGVLLDLDRRGGGGSDALTGRRA